MTKVYVKGLLALLFIVYYGCIHIFTHVHVEDGTPVVHAHPFKKNADGSCHHHATQAELCLFHELSSLQIDTTGILSCSIHRYTPVCAQLYEQFTVPVYELSLRGAISLRAPPGTGK
ncbi:MAG: hypothetical protein LIP06_12415 [Tannerellaceae bacterium]|nr:hypothetical protein [Tannerellaceae bacterium]